MYRITTRRHSITRTGRSPSSRLSLPRPCLSPSPFLVHSQHQVMSRHAALRPLPAFPASNQAQIRRSALHRAIRARRRHRSSWPPRRPSHNFEFCLTRYTPHNVQKGAIISPRQVKLRAAVKRKNHVGARKRTSQCIRRPLQY